MSLYQPTIVSFYFYIITLYCYGIIVTPHYYLKILIFERITMLSHFLCGEHILFFEYSINIFSHILLFYDVNTVFSQKMLRREQDLLQI